MRFSWEIDPSCNRHGLILMGDNMFKNVGIMMLLSITAAYSQPVTQSQVMQAQSFIISEVDKSVDAYATANNISQDINAFCLLKMQNEPSPHMNDGFIPFGINYTTIQDQQILNRVVNTRIVYETIYRKRCMAETKNLIGPG
jgi:hypothetical protein